MYYLPHLLTDGIGSTILAYKQSTAPPSQFTGSDPSLSTLVSAAPSSWSSFMAHVQNPILGADFLCHYSLLEAPVGHTDPVASPGHSVL